MKRLNRRRFIALASVGAAGSVLVACGNKDASSEDLDPTRISDASGAPTLAAMATPPDVSADSSGAAAAGGDATSVDLKAVDLAFEPADFAIAADTDVTVNFANGGALQHNFYMPDPKEFESKVLNGGESETFILNLPAGVYDYWCPIPGHKEAGMVGKITVGASGAAPAPAGGDAATTVALKAVDLAFEPADFTIVADTDVTVDFANGGALQHNFYMPDPKEFESKVLNGGESETFTLNLPAGVYDYWCPIPGHKEAGMVGKITVAAPGGGGGATAASPASSPAAGAAAPAAPAGVGGGATSAELHTVDIAFEPKEFSIAAGTDVAVTVTNKGVLQHDFHVDGLDITTKLLNGGESETVTINAPAGTYQYWCTVPGHKEAGMAGTLTIA